MLLSLSLYQVRRMPVQIMSTACLHPETAAPGKLMAIAVSFTAADSCS